MLLARERKIDLIGGSGFGFDIMRIYPIPSGAGDKTGEKDSIRISVGTETIQEIEKLAELCIEIFTHVL